MQRREAMKDAAIAMAAGATAFLGQKEEADAQTYASATRGLPPLKITKVTCIPCAPDARGTQLNAVKVETSEPGLYGVGCATFQQRPEPVVSAVNDYLDPFCRGKDVDTIEDMWQTAYVSSYWRNGPVLNNAMSGLDQALWDIKGKRAGMPVYQLLGGKCRFAVDCYAHAFGDSLEQLEDIVRGYMAEGFRHVRIQVGMYGSPQLSTGEDFKAAGFGMATDQLNNTGPYLRMVPKMFEYIRAKCGDEIELLHDIHERLHPIESIALCKELERFRPFFIEDPFAPEDIGYFPQLRQQCATPIAMGELYNSPHEWVGVITNRLIDYIRIHISQVGGITPALKVARLAEWFNVRTAWHGPPDVSPPGHAANAHIDLAVWNFGIQERWPFDEATQAVFPGCPTFKNGYMFVNEVPGLGVDIDEKLAAKYPIPSSSDNVIKNNWLQIRRSDGTPGRP